MTLFVMIALHQWNNSLTLLDKYYSLILRNKTNLNHIQLYQRFVILRKVLYRVEMNVGSVGLVILFFTALFTSFATIRMFDIIHMPMYLGCPLGLILALYFTIIGMTGAAKFNEDSKQMLRKWRVNASMPVFYGKTRKIALKSLKSLTASGFCFGVGDCCIFVIKRNTKSTYFNMFATNAMNCLVSISIPARMVDPAYQFSSVM